MKISPETSLYLLVDETRGQNLFKDGRGLSLLDRDEDEKEVLRRYDTVFRLLICHGLRPFLDRQLTQNDVGKNIQETIVDFAVSYALSGSEYVSEFFVNVQYTVLQAALILTITFPLFINPIQLSSYDLNRAFSALIGFAAISHIFCIIALTIMVGYVNRAITQADTYVELLAARPIYIVATIFNYLADITAMICLMIVGIDRSDIDGGIIISICILVCLLLLSSFVFIFQKGSLHQDLRIFQFYQKYCESNGELKDVFLQKVYKNEDKAEY